MPIDMKTALIEKILASIHPLQKVVDEEWKEEAEERISEINIGDVMSNSYLAMKFLKKLRTNIKDELFFSS